LKENDQVAIHKAMEQHTISLAKTEITAILNRRTAFLAEMNPMAGRFDKLKNAREKVNFQSTILSRFEMIFVLVDAKNENRDRSNAEHVLCVHAGGGSCRVRWSKTLLLMMISYLGGTHQKCCS
jgi:DNA replication licensing factor MCM5